MPTYRFTDPKAMTAAIMGDAAARKKRMIEAVQDAVMQGEIIAQQEVDATRPPPVDRGTYRRGFRAQRMENGATLYNGTPYGPVIEDGRRPGTGVSKEGQQALARWVLRKGLVGRTGPRQDREAAARGIAFLIARKIKARGLPAKHVFARTIARLTPIVEAAIGRALSA